MNIKHLLKRTANNVELGMEIERARIIGMLKNIETYPPGWDYDDPFESVIKLIEDSI
jgi:hypothetical protein